MMNCTKVNSVGDNNKIINTLTTSLRTELFTDDSFYQTDEKKWGKC